MSSYSDKTLIYSMSSAKPNQFLKKKKFVSLYYIIQLFITIEKKKTFNYKNDVKIYLKNRQHINRIFEIKSYSDITLIYTIKR